MSTGDKDIHAVELVRETQRAPGLREKLLRDLADLEDSLRRFRNSLREEDRQAGEDGEGVATWLR
jgi:hypothetical protein